MTPPGRPPAGTWKGSPSRKTLPARPEDGTVVSQVLVTVLNAVVAVVAVGENVMSAFGTLRV